MAYAASRRVNRRQARLELVAVDYYPILVFVLSPWFLCWTWWWPALAALIRRAVRFIQNCFAFFVCPFRRIFMLFSYDSRWRRLLWDKLLHVPRAHVIETKSYTLLFLLIILSIEFFRLVIFGRRLAVAATRQRPWHYQISILLVHQLASKFLRAQTVKQGSVGLSHMGRSFQFGKFLNRINPATKGVLLRLLNTLIIITTDIF